VAGADIGTTHLAGEVDRRMMTIVLIKDGGTAAGWAALKKTDMMILAVEQFR